MWIKRVLKTSTMLYLAGLFAALSYGHFIWKAEAQQKGSGNDRPSILATTFPAYDFACQLVGDWVDVQLLLPPGMENHIYEPTPQDILKIQRTELFIFTGGESEHWIRELLASFGADAPRALAMIDCVPAAVEYPLGMGKEHSREHGEPHEETELDEHVWTSPRNVKRIVEKLEEAIYGFFPLTNEALVEIAMNTSTYLHMLDKLDKSFQMVVAEGVRDQIVFGDRFPFRHLAMDYGLRYDAAFPGCSEDSEPSAQTVVSLIRIIRQEKIPVIFYIEFSNRQIANILAEETGAKPLLFHSCHNVSRAEMEAGVTYISLMEQNVVALREALR